MRVGAIDIFCEETSYNEVSMALKTVVKKTWMDTRVKEDQITRYVDGGDDFIKRSEIKKRLAQAVPPDPKRIEGILAKSLSIESLSLDETAALLRVSDPDLLEKMRHTGLLVKKKVYDNRIVTFAPLYLANYCINDCLYCR